MKKKSIIKCTRKQNIDFESRLSCNGEIVSLIASNYYSPPKLLVLELMLCLSKVRNETVVNR